MTAADVSPLEVLKADDVWEEVGAPDEDENEDEVDAFAAEMIYGRPGRLSGMLAMPLPRRRSFAEFH